jgi:hypothetical protein
MGSKEECLAIDNEIRRLSLLIALAQYELREAVMLKTPLGMCQHLCKEIAMCQLQKRALQDGHFEELPYNIKQLFK